HPRGADPVAETAELRSVMATMLDEAIAGYPADRQPPGSWWLPQRLGGSAPSLEQAAALDAAEQRDRAARRRASPT
ncbi:MAG TPA: 1-acyl-sn-glycerol-3-phosphate acyltransferase, partial [Intrasporangium sp.]|nr:1-acyl-sn-glycerol-3-phosphate acyltransferase [Intrasporangium sp.]